MELSIHYETVAHNLHFYDNCYLFCIVVKFYKKHSLSFMSLLDYCRNMAVQHGGLSERESDAQTIINKIMGLNALAYQ